MKWYCLLQLQGFKRTSNCFFIPKCFWRESGSENVIFSIWKCRKIINCQLFFSSFPCRKTKYRSFDLFVSKTRMSDASVSLFIVHIICISLYFKNNTTAWTLFELHRNETLGNFPESKPFAHIKTFTRMTQHWARSLFLMIQVLQAVGIFPEKPAVRSTPSPTSHLRNANFFYFFN